MNMPRTYGTSDASATALDDSGNSSRPAPESPASVLRAFYALVTALALTLLNAVVAVISPPTTRDYAEFIQGMQFPTDPGATRTAAEAGNTAAVVNLIVIVAFVAIFVYFGLLMRRGAAWARVVIAVLAVLGILGGVSVALTDLLVAPLPIAGGNAGVLLLVLLAAALAAYLVFAFQEPSNRFFATSRP